MDVETLNMDVAIGDIIGGRDYLTGLYAKKPIVRKIYRVEAVSYTHLDVYKRQKLY